MKRILSVQDISCVGKCSLTLALPILSAMGIETSVLPTAVLSTHTAFPSPVACDLTDKLQDMAEHWKKQRIGFDGIYSAYLGKPAQADTVLSLAEDFPGVLIVDPVMGDNGKLYSRIDESFLEKMKLLCQRADAVLPNITEACFLTGTPYRENYDRAFINALLKKIVAMGSRVAVITGVSFEEGKIGVAGLGASSNSVFLYERQKLGENYHGTGDIFSSVFSGAFLKGKTWQEAAVLAAEFTARCVEETMKESRDKRLGVVFERGLPWLINQVKKRSR